MSFVQSQRRKGYSKIMAKLAELQSEFDNLAKHLTQEARLKLKPGTVINGWVTEFPPTIDSVGNVRKVTIDRALPGNKFQISPKEKGWCTLHVHGIMTLKEILKLNPEL